MKLNDGERRKKTKKVNLTKDARKRNDFKVFKLLFIQAAACKSINEK